MAVRAVVASSKSRSFVMMAFVPGKFLAAGLSTSSGDQRISVRPDCGGFQTGTRIYFRQREVRVRRCSLRIQTVISNCRFALAPWSRCGYSKREPKCGYSVRDADISAVGRR